jgi:hypothetical protein
MTKLVCSECQRENEPERIFCHSCGARLDRSGLVRKEAAPEKPEQTRQRVERLFDPHRGRWRRTFFAFCKLILAAFVTAVLVEMVLPLELPSSPARLELPPQINFELENALLYHRQLRYSQEQVNAYLAYTLKSKQSSLDKPLLTFKRALVSFGDGTCAITVERSLYSYSIYQRAIYKVNLVDGKIVASSEGGSIGRLPIPPAIMRYAQITFDDLWSALARERKLVAQMGTIQFQQGSVVLSAQQ